MININNFEIINSGKQLSIDVETNEGFNITSILLWKMNDFKDYSLAINLNDNLEQINNKEVFIIDAADLSLSTFEDIMFLEVESDYVSEDLECISCQDPALGITFNLSPYINCLVNNILNSNALNCKSCKEPYFDDIIVTISLLIEAVQKSLEVGFYIQAISMIDKLKKLCSLNECKSCETITCTSCSQFIQN